MRYACVVQLKHSGALLSLCQGDADLQSIISNIIGDLQAVLLPVKRCCFFVCVTGLLD